MNPRTEPAATVRGLLESAPIIGIPPALAISCPRQPPTMTSTLPESLPSSEADPRLAALRAWLQSAPGGIALHTASLRPASADASFRRYFRVDAAPGGDASLIVMDAPPGKEDVGAFCRIAGLLREGGLSAPRVLARDDAQGFVLLSDLGGTTYLDALNQARAAGDAARCDALMRDALRALVRLQGVRAELPAYDRQRLQAEMDLFEAWYLRLQMQAELRDDERQGLRRVMDALLDNVLAQPVVLVHRDYHSRNLMVLDAQCERGNPGVLDFQDAVLGPITYDLVSLLRDAYIAWPEQQQIDWAIRYWDGARAAGLPVNRDFGAFYRDFEWMGLQRQLKVLGIFSRLYHRDGKAQYLDDLPLVLSYVRAVAGRYAEFAPLLRLLDRLHGVARRDAYTF